MDDLLTEHELAVAEGRFRGMSLRALAKELNTNYNSIRITAMKPAVAAYIRMFTEDAAAAIRQSIVAACPAGVATLVEVARDKKAPPAARVSAARALVELGVPREPVRLVHTGDPTEPIHVQHAGQVVQGLSDGDLDAMIQRLTVDDSTGAR
jgi:hypothetical protein